MTSVESVAGFLDEGAGVGEDLLHQRRAVAAEVDQRELVGFQPLGRGLGFQVVPAVAGRELVLGAGLLRHLEEQQVGQLGDVLVVGDAVVLEDVAEVPELGDDVVGDGAHGVRDGTPQFDLGCGSRPKLIIESF